MPKKSGIIFVAMGAVLILSALLLFLYNGYESRRAAKKAELLLDDIQSVIEKETIPVTQPTVGQLETVEPTEETIPPETLPAEMPVVTIDGYDYIGYLSIPSVEIELPVMSEWDYARLKIAPCRQFGSSRTNDLVIAAHNYNSHFSSLSSLSIGADVFFTDMDGIENHYSLQRLDTLAPNMVDEVQNSGYDLVLYTCTPGGTTRVVGFFAREADN